MIMIKLASPIFLYEQVVNAEQENPKLNHTILEPLSEETAGIVTQRFDEYEQYDIIKQYSDTEFEYYAQNRVLFGLDGAIWYCKNIGTEIKPIQEINLPLVVYEECASEDWLEISAQAAQIERVNMRLQQLLTFQTPDVVIQNEKLLLRNYAESLEDVLHHIGYSLVDGWNEDMRAQFARREQKIDAQAREMR